MLPETKWMDALIFGEFIFSPVLLNKCINTVLEEVQPLPLKYTTGPRGHGRVGSLWNRGHFEPASSDPSEKLVPVFICLQFCRIRPISPLCFVLRRRAESFKVPADVFDLASSNEMKYSA